MYGTDNQNWEEKKYMQRSLVVTMSLLVLSLWIQN